MAKERLDVLLVNRGLAVSREKAKAVIMSGCVYVDGQKEDKAGSTFPEEAQIEVRGNTLKYVSRGGLKLEKAMENFDVTLEGKVCMDVGSSTGGFTDCMLQNGAVKVYAVDVGHGQLAWKLRNDERVVCMEKTNIRYVTPEDIADKIQFSSIDVSFISLTKVLGPVKALLAKDGQIVATGVNRVTSNCDPTAHAEVSAIRAACEKLGTFDLSGYEIYTSCEPCPMCLGAIYWAHLDKMYYGNNKTDAKNIGFDDSFIYDELELPKDRRKLPSEIVLPEEAIKAFDMWMKKEDKVEY